VTTVVICGLFVAGAMVPAQHRWVDLTRDQPKKELDAA
jgi:hypothetical protein